MKQFWKKGKKAGRRGFTLIEVLVTVGVMGVLVAVTVPAVTSQISAADPSRVASDLVNITSAIDAFSSNMSPARQPSTVESLVNIPDAAASDINGNLFTNITSKWKGPYIQRAIVLNSTGGIAFQSGYASSILNQLATCNSKILGINCETPGTKARDLDDYLVVQITGLDEQEFEIINKLIDSGETAGSSTSGASQQLGKFRYYKAGTVASSTAYFFATPLLK
jgi:type IV pilus assembly protein PilA